MIELKRGERETALAAKVDAFIREIVIPYEGDPRIDRHGPSDDLAHELKAKAAAAGLLSPHVGEAYGGLGLNHREIATVFRAAGYSTLGPIALNIMAPDEGNMALLEKVASEAQKEHFLRPLAAGKTRSAFFMTEPDGGAGSDPSMMQTTARQDGNHWVINGRKAFITGADGAAFGIIMAKTEEGATLFLADMPDPAIVTERVLDTIDRTMPGGHAVMQINDLRVSADQVLGEVGQGFKYAQVRLAPARLTHCMRWWGAARRAHDIAVAYACKRHAFGKPLIDHEGVGFMLADNEIDLKSSELMIDWCAWVLDNAGHGAGGPESSIAKVAVSEALFRIADRCVQVLGGIGVTDDTPVHQIFRDIRAFRIYDGPSEVHRWSIAKKIKREQKPA
jgi:alkylation response protein AidB-like acyl-CoA dehydrogenase